VSTLYLIRHGQASYGVANYDRLSPRGIQQAQRIGDALAGLPLHADRLDALYAGPLERQRGTAEHMVTSARAGGRELPPITILPELTEYPAFELLRHWVPRLAAEDPAFGGLLEGGMEQPEMIALLDRAFDHIIGRWGRGELTVEGVESVADFVARVRRAIETIVRGHGKGARVAAVTSGGVIGVALQLALGLDAQCTLDTMKMVRNASISEFVWRSNGFAWRRGDFSLVGFNHVHHLGETEMITFR
jgi:broad specificity phosphatase PhoE